MSEKNYYKPLPDYLSIKDSGIHGLGLFATEDISKGTYVGVTHIKDSRFQDGYIRTPLGGFFNHSETPNARVVHDDPYIHLEIIEDVKAGDEILAFYTLYDPTK
jgi:SET domain-containing protein